MSKREFLEILRQTLIGEVDHNTIEQNIEYYDSYITGNSKQSEEEITNQLGDPRLIAKTIIEADRIAKEKGKFQYSRRDADYSYNGGNTYQDEKDNYKDNRSKRNSIFFTGVKWYHKAIIIAIIILFIITLMIVGRILINLLYIFAVPILLILLLFAVFKRR